MLSLISSSNLDGFVVFSVSFAPVALLPGFFFAPAVLRLCSGWSPAVIRLVSGCAPAVRLAKSLFLLAKSRNLRLSSCYVEKCSYLCIVFREREGNAGERPLMARKMRTTEFRACVTSVPRPFFIANTKLKIS